MGTELFNERVKNIVDAVSFKEPKNVPVGIDYLNWPYGFAGVTLEEVVNDPERNAEAYCKFMGEIPFDFSMNPGFYEPYDLFQELGSNNYSLCEDRCTVQHNQSANKFMTEDDYADLIRDPGKFMNETFLKRNVPAFHEPKEKAYEMLKKAAQAAARCVRTTERIIDYAMNRYSIVPLAMMGAPAEGKGTVDVDMNGADAQEEKLFGENAPFFYSPIDSLFDTYRGMMGVFEDLMECPELLEKACDAIGEYTEAHLPPVVKEPETCPLPMGFAVYHAAPYLSPEQYDKFWFRAFKAVMMPYAEAGKKIYIKGESSFMHTIERFKEFPKGSIVIQLDVDDPYEAYKKVGDQVTLATGIRTALFALNDVQRCKDEVKRSFDTFAPGGGFLFYQDKPFLSPSDADPGMVKEVWAFANEYSYGGF